MSHEVIKEILQGEDLHFHVFDTETIGLEPPSNASGTFGGICELSVRHIDPETLETIEHWHSRLDPEAPISPSASGVHGIRDRDVEDMPTMDEFLGQVASYDFWNGPLGRVTILVAHNIKFDYKFVKPYLEGRVMLVDTLLLARRLYPDAPDHKLQTLRVLFDLPFDVADAHSAGGDTASLVNLLRRMMQDSGMSLLELCLDAQRREPIQKISFGKYKGDKLLDIEQRDPGYIDWLLKPAKPRNGKVFELDPDLRWTLEKIVAERVK